MLNSNSDIKKLVASILMCLISLISALSICCFHSASATKDGESTTSSTNHPPVDNAVSQEDTDDELAAFKGLVDAMYNQAYPSVKTKTRFQKGCCNVC